PQPILSDIEFDTNGEIMLGFLDRTGFQWGHFNYYPDPTLTNTNSVQAMTAGDLLRVGIKSGLYELENNGVAGSQTGGFSSLPTQGPGGKEFYSGDKFVNIHEETLWGGLAFMPGSGEIVSVGMDAVQVDLRYPAGGFFTLSNQTGEFIRGSEVFWDVSGTFGKANGLGDVEFVCLPLQVVDYGDLADLGAGTSTGNYNTLSTDSGASHTISNKLRLGSIVDTELNAQPTSGANGDDAGTAASTAINISPIYGTASQSTTGFGGLARYAVDNDTWGIFNYNSTSHTAEQDDPWWRVDFPADNLISRIVLWNRTDGGFGSRLGGVTVQVLDADNSVAWSQVVGSYNVDPGTSVTVNVPNIMGRSVRVIQY
ncbi:MAG: discoidin domain-containing protein, partial [Bacteroidota bacterium]